MVGQAAEGLDANDVGHAMLQQFGHFAAEEPTFPILVAQGKEWLGQLADLLDGHGRGKTLRGPERVGGGLAEGPDEGHAQAAGILACPAGAQVFGLVALIVQRVIGKVHKVRHHGLRAFLLQHLHQVVVCQGHVLDQDLSHDADAGLFHVLVNGQGVKVAHQIPAHGSKGALLPAHHHATDDLFPFLMQGVGAAFFDFIGPNPQQTLHDQIAQHKHLARVQQHGQGDLEARIAFHAVEIQADDGNLGQARFFQRPADERHIIAGAAAAPRLAHDEGQFIHIVLAAEHRFHHLTHGDDGGVAGVVVHVFEAGVDGAAAVVMQHDQMIAVMLEHLFQQVKVDGAHARSQDGIALSKHFFGE